MACMWWLRIFAAYFHYTGMHQTKITNIIWDWNGTLLNDMHICIKGINRLLARRSLPELDQDTYRRIFTFPVRDYYQAAGFDFSREPFETPAEEFILEYRSLLEEALLFPDVKRVLETFDKLACRQFILSAMEQTALNETVGERGIAGYFEELSGISDNMAHSKLASGKKLMQEKQLDPMETIMIGDTLHDYEVATELGIGIILVSRGHQHHERLLGSGSLVLNSLDELLVVLQPFSGNGGATR